MKILNSLRWFFCYLSVLSGLTLMSGTLRATEFNTVLPQLSRVTFVFKQMNVPIEGQFKRFKGQLRFDPAKPAATQADIEIAVDSIDAGSAEANDEVAGKLWFNRAVYPTARFVATSITALDTRHFDVRGTLTMKGKTLEVRFPASVTVDASHVVFEGGFTIKRAEFAIGEGIWADFGTVANEVQVKFRLAAASGKKS